MLGRYFNFTSLLVFIALVGVSASATQVASAGKQSEAREIVLEDSTFRVALDGDTGALTRLEQKATHWTVERRPELGVSFRLHAPLPARRDNFVLGQKQKAVAIKKVSASKVELKWQNLVSEHGGVLPMTFNATISLEDGVLTFAGNLVNDSPLTVETIEYPYFGDLNPPTREASMQVRTMWYGNLDSDEIYPRFNNGKGYWGVFYPTRTFDSNRSLFSLIQAPDQGLYVQLGDASQRYLLQQTFEQHPGTVNSVNSSVPRQDTIDGRPVHLEFRTTHFVFAAAHSTTNLVPVVMRAYEGDWHAGVDLYKKWRATWFKPAHIPEWAKDVHSWGMLRMTTPEQDYGVTYKQFVEYGKEYAANGVKAVQVVGWNRGGQDGDDPSHDTDPGLGTWQDWRDAIAQVEAMGVRVILFGKLNWADLTTDRYKTELYKYAATDPYGIPYEHGGYSYYSPTQLAGINNRRRAIMDFLSPEFRDIATKEFQKTLALGASGWLFDENCHHGSARYNFASGHGYTAPGFIYSGDVPLAAQLRTAADKVNPDFVFGGEGHQDWLMQYYPFISVGTPATPVCAYVDSACLNLAGVSGFDDREKLNVILMNRSIIMYEPFFYKGYLADFPLTMAYGKKIDDLRRKYKDYLWDVEYRDTLGATVSGEGNYRYSVFLTKTGKRAVVVINQQKEKSVTAEVRLPNPGKLVTATPERPEAQPTSGTLEIPARSAAVIMEQ